GQPWRPISRCIGSTVARVASRGEHCLDSRMASPDGRAMERIGLVPFWKSYDRKAVLRTAELAEDLGYDSIWIPEAWAYEQFQLLTEIALHTKRLKLATGIANVFSRS